jgi:hypothetical protein
MKRLWIVLVIVFALCMITGNIISGWVDGVDGTYAQSQAQTLECF